MAIPLADAASWSASLGDARFCRDSCWSLTIRSRGAAIRTPEPPPSPAAAPRIQDVCSVAFRRRSPGSAHCRLPLSAECIALKVGQLRWATCQPRQGHRRRPEHHQCGHAGWRSALRSPSREIRSLQNGLGIPTLRCLPDLRLWRRPPASTATDQRQYRQRGNSRLYWTHSVSFVQPISDPPPGRSQCRRLSSLPCDAQGIRRRSSGARVASRPGRSRPPLEPSTDGGSGCLSSPRNPTGARGSSSPAAIRRDLLG